MPANVGGWGLGGNPRPNGLVITLQQAITAADKAGAWDLLKGDGTMAAGSSTTWVPNGAPTNSFDGSPVRTYTASQNDQQPVDAPFPASSFSMIVHQRINGSFVSGQGASFGTGGAPGVSTHLAMEQGGTGSYSSYLSNGAAYSVLGGGAAGVIGQWRVVAITYNRVGGAADNVLTRYINGVSDGQITNCGLASALSSKWTSNGYAGGTTGLTKSIKGMFVTYKVLSPADIQRISNQLL